MHKLLKQAIIKDEGSGISDETLARALIDELWPDPYEFYHLAPEEIRKARMHLFYNDMDCP